MERQRLQYLLNQYTNHRASPAEIGELNQLNLKSGENKALLSELLVEGFATHREQGYDTTLFDDLYERALAVDKHIAREFTNNPAMPTIHRVHFLRKWGWAAAVLILLGAATVAIIISSDRKSNKSGAAIAKRMIPSDVVPGSNKATLTLADGSIIMLDSAANGQLAMQGNVRVIKDAQGNIIYDLAGAGNEKLLMNTIHTPKGGQYQLALPDGSKVWLNAASSITFPVSFIAKERKVTIQGEAYFEIKPDKTKPFIVNVNSKESVEVLGTDFNINSYEDEENIKTTLIEGSVRVVGANSETKSNAVILKPGEQSQIDQSEKNNQLTNKITVNPNVDIAQVVAWKNGVFNFTNMDIPAVFRQIGRWYDLDVRFEGKLPSKSLRGKLSRDIPLSKVLELLSEFNLEFHIEGKKLTVKSS